MYIGSAPCTAREHSKLVCLLSCTKLTCKVNLAKMLTICYVWQVDYLLARAPGLDPHARLSGIMSDGSHLSLHVVFFDPYLDAASADALPAEVVENTRDEDREFFRPRPNVFVNIPDGQEIIEHRAFGNMRNLRKVLFPASAYAIRKQAFFRL